MKVTLISRLQHSITKRLCHLIMTKQQKPSTNHIVKTSQRALTYSRKDGPFPKRLYFQFDNCSSETNNHYLIAYVQCFVRWKLFNDILVRFLLIEHTQEDIDQSFSVTSEQLYSRDTVTLTKLLGSLWRIRTRLRPCTEWIKWSIGHVFSRTTIALLTISSLPKTCKSSLNISWGNGSASVAVVEQK